MENAIYAVVREHRSLELGIGSIDRFKRTLKVLHDHVTKARPQEIAYILDIHYEVLSKMRQFIRTKHMGDATLKRLHDDLFTKHLEMPKNKTPNPVTKLFEEFIKGITYFKHQIDPSNPIPIYHRFYSCGVGTEIYRGDHLICIPTLTTTEKKRRRQLIERCYLERLIYDELFKMETLHFPLIGTNTEHSQDRGHIFRIDLTRQDYETCFKGHSIDVSVEYKDRFPHTLTVTHTKNGTLLYIEEYSQEIRSGLSVIAPYTGVVICKKTLANGKTYGKVQDFTMEGDWKVTKLTSPTQTHT